MLAVHSYHYVKRLGILRCIHFAFVTGVKIKSILLYTVFGCARGAVRTKIGIGFKISKSAFYIITIYQDVTRII